MGIFALIGVLAASSALAQDAQVASPEQEVPAEESVVSEQIVVVDSQVKDSDIVERLELILETTGRFEDLGVRVENGVLFLNGITQRPEHREKASELAVKVEGVTWVVNNIEVRTPKEPIWNFEPAFSEMRNLWRQAVQGLPLLLLGLGILVLTLFIGAGAARILAPILNRRFQSAMLSSILNKVIVGFIGIVGLYFFLRVSGLTPLAVAMLSGTGVLGLLLGFAFRDIAENFLASVLISVQRPFHIGDTIEVDGYTGIVQKVTTRGTLLMAFDGNHIQIANSVVYKSTIRNLTANPKLRLDFLVGIGYDASIAQAQAVLLKVLTDHDAVLTDPEPTVLVEDLGSAAAHLRVYFWINCHTHSNLKVKSAAIRLAIAALSEAGISMPDDAREIVFPNGVPLIQFDEEALNARKARATEASVTRARKETTEAATKAEGDLGSDVENLNRQAAASKLPEEGTNLLEDQPGDGTKQASL
jgi:small-conductance mechanosensitive channel